MKTGSTNPLIIALPKGRILKELAPLLATLGIQPEAEFFDDSSRKLEFATARADVRIIRVRSFDVATFVAFGAAQLGVAGSDVLEEFGYPDIYAPLDLGIGKCRLSLAEPADAPPEDVGRASHLRIATKYPNITSRYFAGLGVQAECVKLSGAMELAPGLGLARRIVDLVSTGATLKANRLKETQVLMEVSSRLIAGRAAFKTDSRVSQMVSDLREVIHAAPA